ncbi:TPA: hypothetical protein DDW35_01550 [Candidatus Sumerlaeota bacterium]|nr:hypothetical protein [Candidatus Sumerlaeota bacterium]
MPTTSAADAPLTILVHDADSASMRRTCLALARPGIRFVLRAAEESGKLLSIAAEAAARGAIAQPLVAPEMSAEEVERRIIEDFGSLDAVLVSPSKFSCPP